jgi:ABC-type bacteriocin/lantibiotic exporter with double-glycine peptidase domain
MNESIFDYFEPMYKNLYTLDAWTLWVCVWILYIGYYICLYGGFLLLVTIIIVPVLSLLGLVGNIKIKLTNKQQKKIKQKEKLEASMRDSYINRLENANKKRKKHK